MAIKKYHLNKILFQKTKERPMWLKHRNGIIKEHQGMAIKKYHLRREFKVSRFRDRHLFQQQQ